MGRSPIGSTVAEDKYGLSPSLFVKGKEQAMFVAVPELIIGLILALQSNVVYEIVITISDPDLLHYFALQTEYGLDHPSRRQYNSPPFLSQMNSECETAV